MARQRNAVLGEIFMHNIFLSKFFGLKIFRGLQYVICIQLLAACVENILCLIFVDLGDYENSNDENFPIYGIYTLVCVPLNIYVFDDVVCLETSI